MNKSKKIEKAFKPEEIAEFFLETLNEGDIEGIVELYSEDAVLIINKNGKKAKGRKEIYDFYSRLLEDNPQIRPGRQNPAIINGDYALTSSRLINGLVTAEVAQKQTDGSWVWIIDQPVIANENC